MKRILMASAALIAASTAAYACTEGQRERLNARAEGLFGKMNANGSSGQAYMQALQAYGECIAEMRGGNTTPLNAEAFASAAKRYPLAVFKDHPIARPKWNNPDVGAMFEDCRTAKQDDPSIDCSISTEHSQTHRW